MLEVQFAVVI